MPAMQRPTLCATGQSTFSFCAQQCTHFLLVEACKLHCMYSIPHVASMQKDFRLHNEHVTSCEQAVTIAL